MRLQKKLQNTLVLFLETILQHRIDVKDTMLSHSKNVQSLIIDSLHNNAIQGKKLDMTLIEDFLPNQMFEIRKKLINAYKYIEDRQKQIRIVFRTIDKIDSKISQKECWTVQFKKTNESSNNNFNEEITASFTMETFLEILKGLKCQPTLNKLIQNKQAKKKTMLDYKVYFESKESKANLLEYNHSWEKKCYSGQFEITVRCYYNDLQEFYISEKNIQLEGGDAALYLSQQQVQKKNSVSTISSQNRKLSQFYDEDLDITILSSEGQEPNEKNNNKQQKQEQQFQLLIQETEFNTSWKDEEFLSKNQKLFSQLDKLLNKFQ